MNQAFIMYKTTEMAEKDHIVDVFSLIFPDEGDTMWDTQPHDEDGYVGLLPT